MTHRKPTRDDVKAVRQQVIAEEPAALSLMGDFHLAGAPGVRKDSKRALRYFRRAADAGIAEAQLKAAKVLVGMVEAGERGASPLERYIDAAGYAHRAAIGGQFEGWKVLEDICMAMTLPKGDEAAQRMFSDAATGAATPDQAAVAEGVVRDIRRLLDNRHRGLKSAAVKGQSRTPDIQ